MGLRVFQPSPRLAHFLSAIWDYDDLLGGDNLALSILPDTASYLCFLYQDLLTTTHGERAYTTRSGLAGFQSFRSDLGGSGRISGVSARLTPWGLNVFSRGIVSEYAERRVDCRDVFPRYSVEALEERLARMRTPAARVGCVEAFLLKNLNLDRQDVSMQWACKQLDRTSGKCSIAALAKSVGISERTLERRFQSHIGATPKRYARIVRLRNAMLQRSVVSSWAEAAYAAGYYDQSHMIKDFRQFYGLSPESLFRQLNSSRTIGSSGLLNLSDAAN